MSSIFELGIKHYYDQRAAVYDSGDNSDFHVNLAKDFVDWADKALSPKAKSPLRLLDLCCGTGMISFAALDKFGSDSVIHGVDFSDASLALAREKARQRVTKQVEFFESSVTNLGHLPLQKGAYSLITCCSALVLLEGSLVNILRTWGTYLAPDGVIVIDVPQPGTQRAAGFALKVLEPFDVPMVPRDWIESEVSIKKVLEEAGFVDIDVFVTDKVYKSSVTHVSEAGGIFDRMVNGPTYNTEKLTKEQQTQARERFVELYRENADAEGNLKDELRLIVGIAKKGLTAA